MQDCNNSIANALELLQSCTKSWIYCSFLIVTLIIYDILSQCTMSSGGSSYMYSVTTHNGLTTILFVSFFSGVFWISFHVALAVGDNVFWWDRQDHGEVLLEAGTVDVWTTVCDCAFEESASRVGELTGWRSATIWIEWRSHLYFNPCGAEFVFENIRIYLHFI